MKLSYSFKTGAGRAGFFLLFVLFLAACSSDENDLEGQACVEGQSSACACTDGSSGAQVCGEDGTFDPCVCEGFDANQQQGDVGLDDTGAENHHNPDVGGPQDPDTGAPQDPDTGEPDTGEPDAGEPDAGEPDTGEPTNTCGGTEELLFEGEPAEPDDPCGPCGDGVLDCDGDDELICVDASDLNPCDGCAELPGAPGETCEEFGQWACDGDDDLLCLIPPGELFIDPTKVDFPYTPSGLAEWRLVRLENIGAGPIALDAIFVSDGDQHFQVGFASAFDASPTTDSTTPPDILEPLADPLLMRVTFFASDLDPRFGEITVAYDDDDEATVELSANTGNPCLAVSHPGGLDFGVATVGVTSFRTLTIENCAPLGDLTVSDIAVDDDAGGVFSIDPANLPGPLPTNDLVLAPGETASVTVGYSPTTTDGDTGDLVISNDDPAHPELTVDLMGTGFEATCPTAVAGGSLNPGGPFAAQVETTNQEIVYLSGEDSSDPDDSSLAYEWTIINRPSGSMAQLLPSPHVVDPEIEIDIVGTYEIELQVFDEQGLANCDPAIVQIHATPGDEVFLQLVWSSPTVDANYGGPDPSANIGTDLDIYYINTALTSQWNDSTAVYWFNRNQDWGDHGTATLDIDSMYGEGPENISHSSPAQDGLYRVGVHYFNDNGFGRADATLRVYFGHTLAAEFQRSLLETGDLWIAAQVNWSTPPNVEHIDDYDDDNDLPNANLF